MAIFGFMLSIRKRKVKPMQAFGYHWRLVAMIQRLHKDVVDCLKSAGFDKIRLAEEDEKHAPHLVFSLNQPVS